MTGQGPCGPGRTGNGEARAETKAAQPPLQIGKQALLPAEKMRAARDVQEQAVAATGLIPNRHDRRILYRPLCQLLQGRHIGSRIGIAHLQIQDFCAGIG